MIKFLLFTFSIVFSVVTSAQSDGCSAATVLTVSSDCLSPTNGTTTGATQTIAGCTGTADDDVWYQFVATSTSHQIVVNPSASMDPVVQLFSGTCSSLISLVCKDAGLDGITETLNYSSLTIGNTYRVRVYHYGTGSGSGDFSICITTPPPAPANNTCSSPTALNVNATCSFITATTDGATESFPGCSGDADDDVWFSFVATNSLQNIQVSPLDNLDLVFQVYNGSCGSLNSIACIDNTLTWQDEQSDIVGLVPGATYLIRVYDYYQGTTGDFQICITGTPTPTPTNDEACTAIQLPTVTATCQFSQFTTVGATASTSSPTPSACVGGSGAAIGGFSSSSHDVWFSVIVPASGNLDVTPQPNGGIGTITDGVMALYSGSCSSLTQIACSDDNPSYPGATNDLLPLISESGLTPGSTVFIRYWGFGTSSGTFGICASTTTNDNCANALYICDINGYSASTSASYTPDRPDNMHANNETQAGVNLPDGTNSGGPFGQAGPWGTGSPLIDVIINNNSWIKFTASATTATLTVSIYDCWVGNYPSGGLQMQIFEANNCTSFVPVSNFEESSTGFVITANNLTIGNDYYLMVDGYAGDICNYTITADSGVQFPEITPVAPVCEGSTVTLTAPPGATSYLWAHSGETTQTVTVIPATTQSYSAEVTGLCDYKQTLVVDVIINPNPNVSITNGSTISICNGENINLTSNGAQTYVWSTTETGNLINIAPTFLTNYVVTGTDVNGCTNTANIDVSVNSLPTLSVSPTATDAGCGFSDGSLTGAVAGGSPSFTYSWSDGTSTIGSAANLSNIPVGNYYLTINDGNSCSDVFGPFNISNPGAPTTPTITIDDATPCLNGNFQIIATGDVGATFNWTGPNGFTSSSTTINITNVTNIEEGDYCVSQTIAGCTSPSLCTTISLSPEPVIDIVITNNDSTICLNEDFTLTASGANSYTWSGPNGFTGNVATETITNTNSGDAGVYTVIGIDINGCSASNNIDITVLNLPNLTLQADNVSSTYCNGFSAILNASGADSYTWNGPNGFTSTGNPINVISLDASTQGYYIVTGIDTENCINTDSLLITVITDVPAYGSQDTTICPGSILALTATGGGNYVWAGPNGFYSEEQNPLVSNDIDFAGAGWYLLTVIDANGCLGYDSTFIEVSNSANCLFIPNLITPNKDNLNDSWVINGLDKIESAEVSIFNRWGNLIYYASPYKNDWGGKVNRGATIEIKNGIVPGGTYFYIINLNLGTENDIFKGYIEVEY